MPALFHDTASEALVPGKPRALASCGHQLETIGTDRQGEDAGASQQLVIGWAGTAEGLLSVQHRSALGFAGAGCLVHLAAFQIHTRSVEESECRVLMRCGPGAPFHSAHSFT